MIRQITMKQKNATDFISHFGLRLDAKCQITFGERRKNENKERRRKYWNQKQTGSEVDGSQKISTMWTLSSLFNAPVFVSFFFSVAVNTHLLRYHFSRHSRSFRWIILTFASIRIEFELQIFNISIRRPEIICNWLLMLATISSAIKTIRIKFYKNV